MHHQVAVENTTRIAWEYDRDQWTNLADRLRRQEAGVDVKGSFKAINESKVDKLRREAEDSQRAKTKTEPKVTPTYTQTSQVWGSGAQAWQQQPTYAQPIAPGKVDKLKGNGKADKPKGKGRGKNRGKYTQVVVKKERQK